MTKTLCLCLALLHIHVLHVHFVGSQQATSDAAFPVGTGPTGTQTGVFSSSPANSSVAQNGFPTPTQQNDFSQTGSSSPTGSTNPFSQTGTFSSTGSNGSLTQGGGLSQTPPDLSQTGSSSTAQSNNQFSQTGFNAPTQTNSPTFQGSSLSNGNPNGFTNQNNNFSTLEPNITNTQTGVFSPTQPNDPFTQNNVASSSSSNSIIPTQPNSVTVQNGSAMPNQFPNPTTQNGDTLSSQTGTSSTPNNGFVPVNTDSPTAPTNFLSSGPNNNSAIPQPGSPAAAGSASPSVMQLTLATMLAGQYSNIEQFQEDNAKGVTGVNKHTMIEVTYIPAVVPALGQAVVFYYEQRVNNSAQPSRQAIYAFSPESACLTRMATYDIANASRFSVSPEGLQALETLTLAELSNRPECDALWELVDDEFFTSYLSSDQCTFEVSPRVMVRPIGSRNLTCSGMTFTEVWRRVVSNEVIGGSPVPYVFKKTGNAYPVPVQAFSSNTCFKVPCVNSGVASPAGPNWSAIKQHMNLATSTNNGTAQSTSVL